MQTTVGIFRTRAAADRAATQLYNAGITDDHLNVLTPGEAGEQHEAVPTTEAEPPGVGKALGGVVGGTVGATAGLFGAAIISVIPGIGPVLASGLAAMALVGAAGGAVAGAAAGGALETGMATGLPRDELYVYDSALRQGRTVLIVVTDEANQLDVARRVFEDSGAESIDAARQQWWVGMSDAEAQQYQGSEGRAASQLVAYQQGFEAAMQTDTSARSYDAAQDFLRVHYRDIYRDSDFRRGYEQGRNYSEHIQAKWRQ